MEEHVAQKEMSDVGDVIASGLVGLVSGAIGIVTGIGVHGAKIEDMKARLDRIEEKVDRLIERRAFGWQHQDREGD